MSGIEVRIAQLHSRDAALGDEGRDPENGGAVELWQDGKRIVELTWWEQPKLNLETLEHEPELYGHLTYSRDGHFGFASVRS